MRSACSMRNFTLIRNIAFAGRLPLSHHIFWHVRETFRAAASGTFS